MLLLSTNTLVRWCVPVLYQSGSLGKQNQDVCVCAYQEVYFKELSDVIVGVGKSEIYTAILQRNWGYGL